MAIPEHHKRNWETLTGAFEQGRVGLVEVRERATGLTRAAIAAIGFDGREYSITPFAVMIDGNPFEMFDPPNPDGGFHDLEEDGHAADVSG